MIPYTTNKLGRIGEIPVFVDDISEYATEAFFIYTQLINNHRRQSDDLMKVKLGNSSRMKAVESIRNAISDNLSSLLQVQETLEPYISPKILAGFRPNGNDDLSGFLKDLRYIKRDWSWEKSSETQLASINRALEHGIKLAGGDRERALFLGAGVGRIAFDVAHLFDKVYLTDKSFSMAFHYNLLTSGKCIEFNEIDYKNIYSHTDSTRKVIGTMFPSHLNRTNVKMRIDKMEYIVSDAVKLPFSDNSISTVFSIYFTDVISLKQWLSEIKRVLKNDGIFVHFGPLDYFFSDISQMYSAEEIRSIFESNGFETVYHNLVDTVHLPSERLLVNKLYRNWHYVAKRKGQGKVNRINNNSRLEVLGHVEYNIRGVVGNSIKEEIFELMMPSGEKYEGAKNVIEILKLIENDITIEALFSKIEMTYGILEEDDKSSIMSAIEILVKESVIRVYEFE